MGVFLGRCQAGVAQEVLNRAQVGSGIEKVGGTTVSQGMGRDVRKTGLIEEIAHNAPDAPDVQSVPTEVEEYRRIPGGSSGGSLRQSERLQGLYGGMGGGHDAILAALAAADMQGGPVRIQIAPVQSHAFARPQATAVEHLEQRQIAQIAQSVPGDPWLKCRAQGRFGKSPGQRFWIFRDLERIRGVPVDFTHATQVAKEALQNADGASDAATSNGFGTERQETTEVVGGERVPIDRGFDVDLTGQMGVETIDLGSIGAQSMVGTSSLGAQMDEKVMNISVLALANLVHKLSSPSTV